jgi:SAM-dependent methyltransferase
MTNAKTIADHWGRNDVYALIVSALAKMSKSLDGLTVEDLAPVDHFHARGFPATVELADRLPIKAGQHVVDIGCALGGPARYLAKRFQCKVSGIDITESYVEAANKLTALLRMEGQVTIEHGDGQRLPYADAFFDGAYTQHVTMNVADRPRFFAEAFRVLKRGAFFALTEQGLGPKGNPHYPSPWSADGSGAYLVTPSETRALLEAAGFEDIVVEDTGAQT